MWAYILRLEYDRRIGENYDPQRFGALRYYWHKMKVLLFESYSYTRRLTSDLYIHTAGTKYVADCAGIVAHNRDAIRITS